MSDDTLSQFTKIAQYGRRNLDTMAYLDSLYNPIPKEVEKFGAKVSFKSSKKTDASQRTCSFNAALNALNDE